MDIFRLLRQDHTDAAIILMEWVQMPVGHLGAETWARWTERWEVHVTVEENFLFPLLKDEPELRRGLAQALVIHGRILKNIHLMPHLELDSQIWMDAVTDLVALLENVSELEERSFFPRARALMPADVSEDLGDEVEDFLAGLQTMLLPGT